MSTGFTKVVTFGLGSVILGSLFKTKQQKPTIQRIGELSEQTAKEGEPRPIVWGRVRPISGNIMHSSTPRIITREVEGQSSGGGKGGKKKQPKQYEERVFRTYAIRICEGPITAIIRVWRNNKLVYDARGNAWGAQNNGVFLSRARFYLGAWTQMPDPTLESQWGAGNVPAYRGTCYMVVPDEDLTELGGAIPQYIFEVERAEGVALTSRPYALENFDETQAEQATARVGAQYFWLEDTDASPAEVISGELRGGLFSYTSGLPEATDAADPVVTAGELVQTFFLETYSNWPAEATDSAPATIPAGVLKATLINYANYQPEATDALAASVVGGVF